MITWVKPSGAEMTTNDSKETIQYLESLGFKRKDEMKKRGRPAKEKTED